MRIYDRWILKLLAVLVLAACAVILGQSAPRQRIDPGLATLGGAFVSGTAQANGTALHYVRGGTGPAIILLHGFPEDWYEYHRVMPLLAKQFTVVAVDLRGIGGSAATAGGYDAANMAEDVHQLMEYLHFEHVYVVGHDIGGMVAYVFARRYPETCRGVMLLDAPVPGLGPWDAVKANPITWHIHFQQTPDLPEQLIAGREAIYCLNICARRWRSIVLFPRTRNSMQRRAARSACLWYWLPENTRLSRNSCRALLRLYARMAAPT
jgi:pimeloyl-ACP methyl ester carboxylesterase